MHVADDAKLWWRSKLNDIQNGSCTTSLWEDLKRELRTQFFPENVEFIARRKMRQLKHSEGIRDYVKQFSTLMLDIKDMSKNDKVLWFVKGLLPFGKNKVM